MWPFGKSTEKRLKEALDAYKPLQGSDIDVQVDGTTAIISGEVPTERHQRLIEGVARGLNGIDHVDTGRLRIAADAGAPTPAAADTAVDPREVAKALRSKKALADDPIDVWIDAGGVVRLRGAVDSKSEHEEAVAAVRSATSAQVDASQLRIVENVKVLSSTNDSGDVVYTVQSGDTLSAIALKYYGSAGRDSYMRIAEHNNIDNPDLIRVGQQLVIPGSPDGPDAQLG